MKYIDKMLVASGITLVLTGGVAAAALTPSTASAVIAQLPGDMATFASSKGPFGSPNILATAATYIGISEADLRTELQTGKTLAQVAAAHGKTRDGLIASLSTEATKQITTAVDQPGTRFSGRDGGARHAKVTNDIAAAAAYLGTTAADLRTKLQAGQTLAQIAAAAGKPRDGLIAAMVADANAKIDAAVAAGTITAAQASAKKATLTAHITAEVDATRPARAPRP
jgi:DNA-binding phage protein